MRAVIVVPRDVQRNLPLHDSAIVRNKKPPRALLLHRPDEAFDDCDTSMLADCSEALKDVSTTTPLRKPTTSKLVPLIGNKMSRRDVGLADRALNEGAHGIGARLLWEGPEADDASRVVIDGHGEPPTEGPALRQGEW